MVTAVANANTAFLILAPFQFFPSLPPPPPPPSRRPAVDAASHACAGHQLDVGDNRRHRGKPVVFRTEKYEVPERSGAVGGIPTSTGTMKFVAPRPFTNPAVSARVIAAVCSLDEPPPQGGARGGDRDGDQKRKRDQLNPFPDGQSAVPVGPIAALHCWGTWNVVLWADAHGAIRFTGEDRPPLSHLREFTQASGCPRRARKEPANVGGLTS
jgi:hypothetical protein